MLRFFKKLRSNSLSDGRVRKYVLYVLGELLLIVTGIVIAVQINNWNNDRKLRESEMLYLNRIKSDIEADLGRFNFLDSMTTYRLTICDSVLNSLDNAHSRQDKIKLIDLSLLHFYSLNPHTSTYDEMVNTGRLYSTSNKALREKILGYYTFLSRMNDYFDNGTERVKKYMDSKDMADYWLIKRKLNHNLPIQKNEYSWLDKKDSEEWKAFKITTYIYYSTLKKNISRLSDLDISSKYLLKELQEELQ